MRNGKQSRKGVGRKWVGAVLSAMVAMQLPMASPAAALNENWAWSAVANAASVPVEAKQAAEQSSLAIVSETPITAGASLRQYVFSTIRNQTKVSTNVQAIVVDLHNPHVQLDVMSNPNGNLTTRATVKEMAGQTGAVAGTNGDFFNMDHALPPLGPVIDDGTWLASPLPRQGWYMFGLSKDRKPVIDYYIFEGTVTAPNGSSYPLAGMNRASTYLNGVHSHIDKIFMYTPEWGALNRGNDGDTRPTEVLLEDGVVKEIVFGDKLPYNSVPENHIILRVNRQAESFIRNNVNVGDTLHIEYDLRPLDSANPVKGQELQMLIGGHTLLVDQGQPIKYTTDVSGIQGARSRTGVGYSQDGRFVYLITADNYGDSKGLNLKEFQEFMVLAGIWKGMNLDGGGSTQMVARPLGETRVELVNQTEYNSERRVVNGIGVYTTAPRGHLQGLFIEGPNVILLNEKAAFEARGYDNYFNPMLDLSDVEITWSPTDAFGKFHGNLFSSSKTGKTRITASSGKVKESKEVYVAGRKDIAELAIGGDNYVFVEGEQYDIPVVITTRDGLKKEVPSELLHWEFIGFEGTMANNKLTVHKLLDHATNRLIARYDGFSAMLTVPAGVETKWADFDKLTHDVDFIGYPAGVKGHLLVEGGIGGRPLNDKSLYLRYDFFDAEDGLTQAAYASFNGDEGVLIPGEPIQMKVDVLGDNSLNWVRAQVVDANDQLHYIDIHQDINWYGFKEITVDLRQYDLAYPIKMKRIYIARPKERQEERQKGGAIVVDDISFLIRGEVPPIEKPEVQLTIGKEELTVNGELQKLDQAPLIVNSTTLIPVRFIVDALGGEVEWDAKEQKVTLLKNDVLIDLWIDEQDVIVNGKAVKAPVTPTLMNGRTMVPLRLVSEAFGWKVDWEAKTETVTLQ